MGLGSKILRNTTYLTVGNQIGNLLQFLFFLIFARYFGQVVVGQYSFAFSFTYLLSVLADLGLSAYIIREVARDQSGTRYIFLRCLTLRLISILLFFTLGTLIIIFFRYRFSDETLLIILYLGIFHIFFSIADVFLAEFNAHHRMGTVALLTILLRFLISCPAIFLILLKFHFLTVLICFPIGSLIYLISCIYVSRRYFTTITFQFADLNLKELFIQILPFMFAILFVSTLYHQDILVLRFLRDNQIVGIFSAANRIILALLGILVFVYTALLPTYSRLYVESTSQLLEIAEKSLRYLLLLSLPMATGLFAISDKLIVLCYSDAFLDSALVLRILCWTVVIGFTAIPYSVLLTAINRQTEKVIVLGVCLLVNLLLNLLFIPKFDASGAAVAKLITEALIFLLMAFLVTRYFNTLSLYKLILKPSIACGCMYIFLMVFSNMSLFWLIPLSALVYHFSLVSLRAYNEDESELLRNIYSRVCVNTKSFFVYPFRK